MSVASALKKIFSKPYGKVSATQAAALADRGAILLDVREPREWQAGHAPRARHIPLSQVPRRAGELPKGRAVVTVCRSGARSARAAATARPAGPRGLEPGRRDACLGARRAAGRRQGRRPRPRRLSRAAGHARAAADRATFTNVGRVPGRSGEPTCAVLPSAIAARRSPGPAAAPTRSRSWPASRRRNDAPAADWPPVHRCLIALRERYCLARSAGTGRPRSRPAPGRHGHPVPLRRCRRWSPDAGTFGGGGRPRRGVPVMHEFGAGDPHGRTRLPAGAGRWRADGPRRR